MRKAVLVLALSAGVAGCIETPAPEIASAPRRELSKPEKDLIAHVVSMDMKDPDAAKFLWVPIIEANVSATYCGLVNGKNSYGGYIGYHPFMVRVTPDTTQPPVTGASVIGFSTGPDEYGNDPIAGSCSHFGYVNFGNAHV